VVGWNREYKSSKKQLLMNLYLVIVKMSKSFIRPSEPSAKVSTKQVSIK